MVRRYCRSSFTRGNGLVQTVRDGENNLTSYEYDGHDRLSKTYYPLPSPKGAGASNAADYEQTIYEVTAGGARTSGLAAAFRNRAGDTIGFGHDSLGRMTHKDRPDAEPDSTYGYDLPGQLISAGQPGQTLGFTYDALGRVLTETGPLGAMTSEYDLAGRRTRLTWPDSFFVTYDHLVTGEVTAIRENGAASGIGVIASLAYDNLGRRTSLTLGNGLATHYQYDPASRLGELKLELPGTSNDLTSGFAYNPAGQIASTTRSNDLYAWTGHGSGTTSTTADGLNRIAGWGNALGYDAKGNIVTDGAYTYTYSSENLLTSLTNPTPGAIQSSSTYAYDPLMRLAVIDSSNPALDVRFGYDGQEMAYEGLSGGRTRRYVHGPGVDEPLVGYLVTPTGTSRLWYQADERGSITRLSNDAGTPGGIGKYDEYGAGGTSRFRYTGQYWLGDANLLYYRARIYDPRLGRFLQPDPIGYGGGMNMYAYVGGDPVNFTDPLGLLPGDIFVDGHEERFGTTGTFFIASGITETLSAIELVSVENVSDAVEDIVITGKKLKQQVDNKITIANSNIRWHRGRARIETRNFFERATLWFRDKVLCGCFEDGTVVATPQGLRRIEEIKIGDLVMSRNEQTGEIGAKPVTDLIQPEGKELYELRLVNQALQPSVFRATDDHPWKAEGKGWVETAALQVGDRIDTASGADLLVTAVTLTGERPRTYNLTVADWHTFMVGEEWAVVHNAICGKSATKLARQMEQRGWTDDLIEEAKHSGEQVSAINKRNGNSATRYIHPTTGQSVVIDDLTGAIIHVGGPGFTYGPESGDVP